MELPLFVQCEAARDGSTSIPAQLRGLAEEEKDDDETRILPMQLCAGQAL